MSRVKAGRRLARHASQWRVPSKDGFSKLRKKRLLACSSPTLPRNALISLAILLAISMHLSSPPNSHLLTLQRLLWRPFHSWSFLIIVVASSWTALICVARGWTWKCETHESRMKCLRKNPRTPNTHSHTLHTHYHNLGARVQGLWYWKISLVSF